MTQPPKDGHPVIKAFDLLLHPAEVVSEKEVLDKYSKASSPSNPRLCRAVMPQGLMRLEDIFGDADGNALGGLPH